MAQQTGAGVDWNRAHKGEQAAARAAAREDERATAATAGTASPATPTGAGEGESEPVTVENTEQATLDAARAEFEAFEFIPVKEGWVNVANTSYAEPRKHVYSVRVSGETAAGCSCPHDTYREGKCKHRRAVEADIATVKAGMDATDAEAEAAESEGGAAAGGA
jgi:hypothetical protein